MESIRRYGETATDFALGSVDDGLMWLCLNAVDGASMTQNCAELFCAAGEGLDEDCASDPQPVGGQQRFNGGSVFLNKADAGKRKRSRGVKPAGDTQAGESFNARRQNAFAASLISRKIAALDNDH